MVILRGTRKGAQEIASCRMTGASFNRIRSAHSEGESGGADYYVLMFDAGGEELVEIRLYEEEAVLVQMALQSPGAWVYPKEEHS